MTEETNAILMVDDEKDMLDFFSEAFRPYKHIRFFAAWTAEMAREIVARERPRVILLDLKMPDANGEDLLKEFQRALPLSKIVIVTAWNDGRTRERICEHFKIDAYFEKPFELEKLINKSIELVMVK